LYECGVRGGIRFAFVPLALAFGPLVLATRLHALRVLLQSFAHGADLPLQLNAVAVVPAATARLHVGRFGANETQHPRRDPLRAGRDESRVSSLSRALGGARYSRDFL